MVIIFNASVIFYRPKALLLQIWKFCLIRGQVEIFSFPMTLKVMDAIDQNIFIRQSQSLDRRKEPFPEGIPSIFSFRQFKILYIFYNTKHLGELRLSQDLSA